MLNRQQIIESPMRPRREDARDLQSRLYREIGLAAVAAELFGPQQAACAPERRANVKIIRIDDRAA